MGGAFLRDILVIFLVAIPVVIVTHRLRFPAIVGFLVTGFIIGPYALGLVPEVGEIKVLAETGVALLLFSIALEFSFDRLKGWGRQIIGLGLLQIVLTTAIGFAVGQAWGWLPRESIFLGCAIALSSSAIVMAILSQKRWFDAPAGRIATGILILQDLAVIPMMVLLKMFVLPYHNIILSDILLAAVKIIALTFVLIMLSRWAFGPFLRYAAMLRSKELFVIVVVGLALASSYATERLGFSFALGAFLAGLAISTTEFRFHALSEIAPFRHCFNGLFFVTVGMMVNPIFVLEHWPMVVLLVFLILFAKLLTVGSSILLFGYPVSVAVIGSLMLLQVGEFSFMLVFFGWQAGAVGYYFQEVVVTASAITMIIAPFFVAISPKVGKKFSFVRWRLKLFGGGHETHLPDQERKLSNHAIICGFGPLGMTIAELLSRHKIPYIVLELNPATAKKVIKRGGRAYIGDGASAELLSHSGIEMASLLAIAVPDHLNAIAIIKQARQMNDSLYIITRSRWRDQVQKLYDAGADVVICEELEGGIEMGRHILDKLGVPQEEAKGLFKEMRSLGNVS